MAPTTAPGRCMPDLTSRRKRRQGGYTLVEVLASVVILSIGLLAIVSSMQASRDSQQRARCMTIAKNIAQSQIEGLRSLPWAQVKTQPDTSDPSLPSGNTISVTVSNYPNSSSTNLVLATVVVRWPENSGSRAWTYETLIANH